MKKYNEFISENWKEQAVDAQIVQDEVDDIDSKFQEFKNNVKNFISNNFITQRGLDFKRDTDEILEKKRKQEKFREYWNQIDKILQDRKAKKEPEQKSKETEMKEPATTTDTTTEIK